MFLVRCSASSQKPAASRQHKGIPQKASKTRMSALSQFPFCVNTFPDSGFITISPRILLPPFDPRLRQYFSVLAKNVVTRMGHSWFFPAGAGFFRSVPAKSSHKITRYEENKHTVDHDNDVCPLRYRTATARIC
jgi:hypothetical protein